MMYINKCAQIAPSSFKMIEDSGRARTYYQSSTLDVESAVMVRCCQDIVNYDGTARIKLIISSLSVSGVSSELHALHVI